MFKCSVHCRTYLLIAVITIVSIKIKKNHLGIFLEKLCGFETCMELTRARWELRP